MSESPVLYSRREWLNPEDSHSTGSVVAWVGRKYWGPEDERDHLVPFLEVADCLTKVRLHGKTSSPEDTGAFVRKMRLLAEVITEVADQIEAISDLPTDQNP